MADTLHNRFLNCAARYGDETALKYKEGGVYRDISWRAFADAVRDVALGLSKLGVVRGDRVAILSENRPEWAISDLAILSEGAITVPIYQTNTARQVAYILNNAEAKAVIVSTAEQLQKITEAGSDLTSLEKVVVMDPVSEGDVIPFDLLRQMGKELHEQQPELFQQHVARAVTSDTATIIYTSGTTGDPKGVMLTHGNILFNCDAAGPAVPVSHKDTCLSFLPLSHVFERTVGQFFMIFNGITIAYAESVDTVAENMGEVRPTVMISVPRLYEKMHARVLEKVKDSPAIRQRIFFWGIGIGQKLTPYRLAGKRGPLLLQLGYAVADHLVFSKIKERLGGRLRYFISGGAPLSQEIAEFFYAAGVTIVEGYGLTETSPVITANRHDRIKFGAIGLPLDGVEVKIAEDGEILTRSPSVMKGYFRNEQATRDMIDDAGWLHTGDVGVMDEDGFVTITDRKKDIIVTSGGKNVSPQNIENLLTMDPYISQVVVYGDRRKYLTALVVPDFEKLTQEMKAQGLQAASDKELVEDPRTYAFMMSRVETLQKDLARFEKIKRIALLDQELTQENGEITPTMKVRRKTITAKYGALLEKLYEE